MIIIIVVVTTSKLVYKFGWRSLRNKVLEGWGEHLGPQLGVCVTPTSDFSLTPSYGLGFLVVGGGPILVNRVDLVSNRDGVFDIMVRPSGLLHWESHFPRVDGVIAEEVHHSINVIIEQFNF